VKRIGFTDSRAAASVAALIAVALVAIASILLLRYQHESAGAAANERSHLLERFGSAATDSVNAVPDPSWNTLELGTSATALGVAVPSEPTATASARWDMNDYEFGHLFASNPACSMSLFALAEDPVPTGTPATIQILLNGRPAETLQVSGGKAIPGAVRYEHAVSTQPIFLGPLFQPSGHLVPVPWNACAEQHWRIEIRVSHVRWKVGRVGVIARYTLPRPELKGPNAALAVLGCVVVAGLAAAFFALFQLLFRRYGPFSAIAALIVTLGATLTHDQWDFPVWVRYVDLLAFGHGNPVTMTAGSPFWAYLTSVLAPVAIAAYGYFNYGSDEVTALFLKLSMALACCFTAYMISRAANVRVRRMVFLFALVSPVALYGLAGGYREVWSAFFAVGGILSSLRRRYILASVLFAAAGTISESLLPLSLLPAATIFLNWRNGSRTVVHALACIVVAFGLVSVPWLTFPHDQIAGAITFRTGSYRFGGASWQSVAESYGMSLQFVKDHGLLVNVVSYTLLALGFFRKYILLVRDAAGSQADRERNVLYVFLGLEFAFFLCYTGVDPNTWYGLGAVVFIVLNVTDPFNPFPLVLSLVCGLTFYSIAGLGDFVNWTYLWPVDLGLLGILGHPMYVFIGLANLLILGGWVAALRGDFRTLFGNRSLALLAAFGATCVAVTIFQFPEDTAFCLAFAGFMACGIYSTTRILQRRGGALGIPNLQYLTIALGLFGAYTLFAQGLPTQSLVALALALIVLGGRIGLADIVPVVGTFWLISIEPGTGWLSVAGYLVLAAVLLAALWSAHRGTLRRYIRRPKLGFTRVTIQWESASRAGAENNHAHTHAHARDVPELPAETKVVR
jgi:hypothetical protein